MRGRITGSVKVTVSSQGGDVAGFKAALQKRVEEVTKKKEEHKKNVSYIHQVQYSLVDRLSGGCIQLLSIKTGQ